MSISPATANREVSASASIPGATAVRYQWTFNGQAIPQADDPTYTPSPEMAGGTLGVIATGYAVGSDPSPQAQASQVVAPAAWYANTGVRRYPEIVGKVRVGQKLTAVGLDWVDYFGGKPAGFAPVYKWTRNGRKIKGARAATYRLTAKDKGKKIQVREYPRATGFATSDYARSDVHPQGPHRQAVLAAPEDRRQGQGRQARRGPHEGLDQGHEVPLPVVRRQDGGPRCLGQEAAHHPVDEGQEAEGQGDRHQEGVQEGQRDVAGHEGEVTLR